MHERWLQVAVSFQLSYLLFSMFHSPAASFSGGPSHKEQDGSYLFNDLQTGSHCSGIGGTTMA